MSIWERYDDLVAEFAEDQAELERLRTRNAQLVEALTDAIHQVTHAAEPRADGPNPVYRSEIPCEVVYRWRKALAANKTDGE